jgi:hypothetical protein
MAGLLFLIGIAAVLIALILSPAGDPFSFVIAQVMLMAFGFGAFFLGRMNRSPANLPTRMEQV